MNLQLSDMLLPLSEGSDYKKKICIKQNGLTHEIYYPVYNRMSWRVPYQPEAGFGKLRNFMTMKWIASLLFSRVGNHIR